MNFSAEEMKYLARHQSLTFSCEKLNGKADPSALACSLRNLYLHQLHYGKINSQAGMNSQAISEDLIFAEAEEYLRKYSEVVDNMDEGGLNNYAEGALALCQYQKNESSKWETALTESRILQMPILKDIVEDDEQLSDSEDVEILLNSHVPSSRKGQSVAPAVQSKVSVQPAESSMKYNMKGPQFATSSNLFNTSDPNEPTASMQQTGNNLISPIEGRFQRKQEVANVHSSLQPSLFSSSHGHGIGHHDLKVQVPKRQPKQSFQQVDENNCTEIKPSSVGGPYANFGQKRKNPSSFYNKANRNSKSWVRGKGWTEDKDDEENTEEQGNKSNPFKTARDQLVINQQKKGGVSGACYGATKKSLGTRRGPASKFVPPVLNRDSDQLEGPSSTGSRYSSSGKQGESEQDEPVDERLKGLDPKMIELITNEIMDTGSSLTWSDIAGLEFAKKTIQEIVVWPMLRPDIFTGLRGPPKGLLLFGPPGTGKTLIGKCVANQSKSTFFCISASSLTSKWVGEGEKMVRTLFAVARCNQPAVIFIDEIDSLLSQRSDSEHESSRRIKTEFLVQLDGATTESEDRILVIGATNRPQEIDEAARRRFVKRLHIPLPEAVARRQIVVNLMAQQQSQLDEAEIQHICERTEGYSGADMTNLCREAALGPIRSIPFEKMETITPDQVRPIQLPDFEQALLQVRASVSDKDLELYAQWNRTFGSFGQ